MMVLVADRKAQLEERMHRDYLRCVRLKCRYRPICYGWLKALLQMGKLAEAEDFLGTKCPTEDVNG